MTWLLPVVLIAYVGVWAYNRYQRASRYLDARRQVRDTPRAGQVSSAAHKRRAEDYAETLTPKARETAQRLLGPEGENAEWVDSATRMYKRVAYRIPADNNSRVSVSYLVDEIVDTVDARYPDNEQRAAEFAAYLAAVASEALVYMLPLSGGQAATELLAEVGKGFDQPGAAIREPTRSGVPNGILRGQLPSAPSVEVLLRIGSDEVLVFSPDVSEVLERIPFDQIIPPGATPPPPQFAVDTKGLTFQFHSVDWFGFTVYPPVGDEWFRLGRRIRDLYRERRARTGSEQSPDPMVAGASEAVQRVWHVLPASMREFDVGIVIEDISWQTGLDHEQIESALTSLDSMGLIEQPDTDRYRRVSNSD